MQTIKIQKIVNAPVDKVWASWDDFGNIYKFNPNVDKSHILSSSGVSQGRGARRECELNDGKNWLREKIVDYIPGRKMTIDVYEASLPLKTMSATIELRAITDQQTEVRMSTSFEPKMGILGKLMAPLMKRKFHPMLAALLDGNAAYVENGSLVAQAA